MSLHSLKYHPLRVTLHWLSAVIIIWSLISGFTVYLMDLPQKLEVLISFINISLTTLFIPVFAFRIFAALALPALPNPLLSNRNQMAAHLAHQLLYIVITVELITGILMMKYDINVFNLITLPAPLKTSDSRVLFTHAHVITSIILLSLVSLHIIAVIKHQLCGKSVLGRMQY